MASFPGSGNDWTTKELAALNIRVADAPVPAFFANSELPPTPVSSTILDNLYIPPGHLRRDNRLFFQYLMLEERATSEEYAVDNFTGFLLRMLRYDEIDGVDGLVQLGKDFSFDMAGKRINVWADVCVMQNSDDLLLVHIERSSYIASLKDPQRQQSAEPQIIAGAIAAYYQNNLRRTQAGLPALPVILMPGITMHGTAPVFYHIPVSPQLLEALATSTYPKEETVVLRFIPPVANPETYLSDGIRPLDNRRIILQCFEAFKASLVCLL